MKIVKTTVVNILVFIGFLVTVLGTIIDPLIMTTAAANTTGATFVLIPFLPLFIILASVLGTAFVFSKNETLANAGYGLLAFDGAIGIMLLALIDAFNLIIIPIGLIVMFVGATLRCIVTIIGFFGFVKGGTGAQTSDSISTALIRYKELEKDGVLSEEEFANLKGKTFAADDQKITSFDDLKKWKKLLDQNVITEEEFAALKAKLFAE